MISRLIEIYGDKHLKWISLIVMLLVCILIYKMDVRPLQDVSYLYTTFFQKGNSHAGNGTVNLQNNSGSEYGYNENSPSEFYAAFGCGVIEVNFDYAFLLPLTALAWERVGFQSLIILMGTQESWRKCEVKRYIVSHLEERRCQIVYLPSSDESIVSLSQISRLFSYKYFDLADTSYILTSDADLWPLHRHYYLPSKDKAVLSTNAFCCGSFKHKGNSYPMRPMSTIGMSVEYWKATMEANTSFILSSIPSALEIQAYFAKEFGDLTYHTVKKGHNFGWYMDQKMVSIRLKQLEEKCGGDLMEFVEHKIRGRINRRNWKVPEKLNEKLDAHLILKGGYKPPVWNATFALVNKMYQSGSPEITWVKRYQENFPRVP